MRFLALFKKDLQECLGVLLLMVLIISSLGGIILRVQMSVVPFYDDWNPPSSSYGPSDMVNKRSEQLQDSRQMYGYKVSPYQLIKSQPLGGFIPLLSIVSIVFGSVMGAGQFFEETKQKTWAFTVHRSMSRSLILWAKFGVTVAVFMIGLGGVWTLFFFYALSSGVFPCPPTHFVLIKGWVLAMSGLPAYFAVALVGVRTKELTRPKIYAIIFVLPLYVLAALQSNIVFSVAVVIIGIAIVLPHLIYTFLNKEF